MNKLLFLYLECVHRLEYLQKRWTPREVAVVCSLEYVAKLTEFGNIFRRDTSGKCSDFPKQSSREDAVVGSLEYVVRLTDLGLHSAS